MKKPSFAKVAKNMATASTSKAILNQKTPAKKLARRKQHLAVVRPINENETSTNTRACVQKNIDINQVKIGIKKVAPIKKGGIIIEAVEEDDLDKLIKELQNNPIIASNYKIGKPLKRKPHFICYGVSEELTADAMKANIMHQCHIDPENSGAINIVHSYKELVFCNQEMVIIKAQLGDHDTLLISTYCPPNKDLDINLGIIRAHIHNNMQCPIVLLGDFNAKSRVWGQRNLDERGSKLLTLCQQLDLSIENQPNSPPTYSSSRGDSWIDLLISKNLDSALSLEISDHITNSDHNLLIIRHLDTLPQGQDSRKIKINSSNWISIKTRISNILWNQPNTANMTIYELNSLIEEIQKNIFSTLAKPCNTSSNNGQINKTKKSAIWWTKELGIKRSKTRALRRCFQKERDLVIRVRKKEIFKRNFAEYKKMILLTKKEKFKTFVQEITNNSLFGNFYDIINDKRKRKIIHKPIFDSTGNLTSSINDAHKAILDYHFPWTVDNNTMVLSSPQYFDLPDFTPITITEVEGVINRVKPRKATGIDDIPGEIVKELLFGNKTWFTQLLNSLLSKGTFPAIWKSARVVLIEKEGKTLDHPSHFRPICILPCWGKILDKILTERLAYHLESANILSDKQFGFRRNKSTILAIKNIMATSKKHLTCIISIDMSNAFNSVNWRLLKQKIDRLDIPSYLKVAIFSFLSERSASLHHTSKDYNEGVPQGSSLGPVLWNIFIDEILRLDFGSNVKIQAFADDLLLMIQEPATHCFTQSSKVPLRILANWINDHCLTINYDKCCFTVLSAKRFSHIPSIKID
ncbi:RNA-directed DNA polymerase from mobile element jockey [Caerostris darwini]|uniref:RNA-directed DNA polymerase from mobile element jockey n=1 Tax=Caerostris darwini TaxID=1538125 RepID=A0AAV4MYH5_9ARAC|nr:RNA-directed DNA polymerase from mobile element jockey [Caerostris darwini]